MARLDNETGKTAYDKLFAGAFPTALIGTVKVKGAKNETLKRGTLLTGEPGGDLMPVKAALAVAASGSDPSIKVTMPTVCVLCDDTAVKTDSAVKAQAYKTGCFEYDALFTASEYTLTPADIDYLRIHGIIVENCAGGGWA